MPTRLYLRSNDDSLGAFDTSPVLADGFNAAAPPVFSMGPTKLSTAMATTTPEAIADGAVAALAVFISPAAASEVEISASTMTAVARSTRSGGSFAFPHAKAWVLSPDGSIKGVIKTAGPEGSFSSIETTPTARAFASSALSSLTLEVGDRLAVAIGAEAFSGACSVSVRVGDAAGADLSGAGDTDDDAPWIDWPDDMTFDSEGGGPGVVEGAGAAALSPPVGAGTAQVLVDGAGTGQLLGLGAAGATSVLVDGAGAAALRPLASSGAAHVLVSGAGAASTPALEGAGSAQPIVTGGGAGALSVLLGQGTAEVVDPGAVEGGGSGAVPGLVGDGAAAVIVTGAGAAAAPLLAGAGTAVTVVVGAGAAALPPLGGAGAAIVGDVPLLPPGPTLRAAPRRTTLEARARPTTLRAAPRKTTLEARP